MAHMARGEGYQEEQASDEDRIIARHHRGRGFIGTDEYIESKFPSQQPAQLLIATEIVGPARSESETDSDFEIIDVKPSSKRNPDGKPLDKGKEKKEKSLFSDDEDIYEKFKNRKSEKRKQTAATKKKLATKTKDAIASRKKAKDNGEVHVAKGQRVWGDESDYEMDEDIPDYLHQRRKEFDTNYHKLAEGGLCLPPSFEEIEFSDNERLAELEERPDFPPTVETSRPYKDIDLPHSLGVIPASIAQYLRDYQVDGVAFLHELFVYQKGGILGDDMGLGKTVQVAAFLTAAFGKTGDERDAKRMRKMRRSRSKPWYPRVLIVCPGSLIENWKNELARWGWWQVDKYHGSATEREAVLQAAMSGRLEVVITTYTTYLYHKSEVNMVMWDCVVADECHILKDRKSQTTQAMNELNALCRIGLTGTAIQNKYEELWTLLNWTNPGRFGPLSTWVSSISDPLRIGQS
jgi:DNA excision repair protein ERCC-6-like 2